MNANSLTGHVVIVEDVFANLPLLEEPLTRVGLSVRATNSDKSSVTMALSQPTDLILLDAYTPDQDSFKLCEQLKKATATKDIPIIFIGDLSNPHDRIKGLNMGAVDYITKPFDSEEVLQRVRIHLELHQMRRSLEKMVEDRTKELHTTVQALKTLSDVNQALIRSVDEDDLLQRICHATHHGSGFPLVWIGLLDENTKKLQRTVHMGGDQSLVDALSSIIDQGCSGDALVSGVPVQCDNLDKCDYFSAIEDQLSRIGASSLIALPLKYENKLLGVINLFSSKPGLIVGDTLALLMELADDLGFGISHLRTLAKQQAEEQLRLAQAERLNRALGQTIQAIARTVEKRDPYTAGHQARVAELALAIGKELNISGTELKGLHMGAMIHDLGKIYVPAEFLNRPGRLSSAEWKIISAHPQVGHDIIKDVDLPWPVAEAILQHHERFDGSGYPQGLKGNNILREARIIAVADVLEALSNHRPYRAAMGLEAALAELEHNKGTHFDPEVVDACIRLFRDKGFRLPVPEQIGANTR